MAHQIIFESEDIVLHYNSGNSDFLVLTFLGIGNENNATSVYFGKPIVEEHHICCIGVTTKIRNWYYSPNMEKALEIIQAYIAKFSQTISFGLSAGAYAAVKYSARLGVKTTIALAPQLSIDDTETEVIPEWAALCTPEMRGMGIKAADIFGDIFLFYDKRHVSDSTTAATLAEYASSLETANIYKINVPHAGHIIYESIRGRQNIMAMISLALATLAPEQKQKQFVKLIRYARRLNTANIYNKIMDGYIRHPYLTYQLLQSPKFLEVKRVGAILQAEPLFYKIISQLHLSGFEAQARHLLRAMLYYHTVGHFTLSTLCPQESLKNRSVLLDHRGRTLGFSLKKGAFTSSNLVWMENDAAPVSIATVNGVEYLSIYYLGDLFFLSKKPYKIALSSTPDNLYIERTGRQCGVRCAEDGTYLTIIDDLRHTWAQKLLLWERFCAISF